MFNSGNVIFKWTSSNYSFYDVVVLKDHTRDSSWTRVYDTQYTVKDVMLYDLIKLYVHTRAPGLPVSEYNIMPFYNGLVFFFHIYFLVLFFYRN